jgi:transcriptional regulator with PAS, ATPase and Fis domain
LTQAVERARLLANVPTPVLLQGETGVGKDVFARAIHDNGPHSQGPFVALNCGGLPREILASELFGYSDGAFTGARRTGMIGKIEAAHGGTLFLDEIAEMPLDLQPYLLRVLEGGELYPLGSNKPRTVKFRLIAACNRDLRSEVSAERFRMDLFYRVSVTSLHIPPLRDRTADLPALVAHFAREAAMRHGVPSKAFSSEVMMVFARYDWPGNLRELRNVVEAMSLLAQGEIVDLEAIPADFGAGMEQRPNNEAIAEVLSGGLEQVECHAIVAAIRKEQGNLTRAARQLHIARSTLYLKMKKYALSSVLDDLRVGTLAAKE